MPKATPIQTSFNGGIQSPLLAGHINAPRRDSSIADSTNLLALKHGPVVRRGGTKYAGILREPTTRAFLHKFEFSDTESFVLEFSEDEDFGSIFRVYKNNFIVFRSSSTRTITGITDVTDPVVTVSATLPPFSPISGISRVFLSGLTEAIELNDRWFKVKAKLTSTTYSIMNYDGTSIGGLSTAETSSTGQHRQPANQVLPFCNGDMFAADGSFIPKIVQSNDVIYMVHPDYAPRIIVRAADDAWPISIAQQNDGPYLSNTTGINMVSPFANGAPSFGYYSSGTKANLAGSESTSKFTMIPVKGDAIINNITNGTTPRVTTVTAHGFVTGDVVTIDGLVEASVSKSTKGGMTELNGKSFTITLIDSTNFDLDGIDTTNFSAYTTGVDSGGLAYIEGTYRVAMDDDVFVRSDSTFQTTINYATKANPTLLDIKSLPIGTEIQDGDSIYPTGVSGAGMIILNSNRFIVDNIGYKVRAVHASTQITQANPAKVTTALAHELVTGSVVFMIGVAGMVELLQGYYTITVVDSTSFTLDGEDSTLYTSHTAGTGSANTTQLTLLEPCTLTDHDSTGYDEDGTGGTIKRGESNRLMHIRFEDRKARTRWLWGRISKFVNAKEIHWQVDVDAKKPPTGWLRDDRGDFKNNKKLPAGPGGRRDDVYRENGSEGVSEQYGNIEGGDEWELGVYSDTTLYPSVVTIHQGRVVMGSSAAHPRRIDLTETGGFSTTSVSFKPFNEDGLVVDSNAISIDIGGGDGSGLQWVQSLGGALAVGSTSSEGMVEGGSAGSGSVLTPSNAAYRTQSTSGSSSVQPVVIGRSLLHVQRTGRRIYELTYNIDSDGYSALDLTELAEHLTRSGVIDFAWQQNPINTLWCVLENGGLIALTYEKNADVIGWHHHTIGGTDVKVESVAVIPSPDLSRDELWMVVKRTINGTVSRTVEYMDRWYEDDIGIRNAYHVDGGVSYDTSDVTITGVTQADPAVVTTGTHGLSTGNVVRIDDVKGMTRLNEKYFFITVLSSTTFSLKTLDGIGLDATGYDAFTSGIYQKAENTFRGLDHLEGETIQILRDGQTHPDLKVCGGIVELGTTTSKTITGITQANPAVVTSVNHNLSNGDRVTIADVVGMIEVNDSCFIVANKANDTFELTDTILNDIDSTSFTAYTSGGTATSSDLNVYGATVAIGLPNVWFMQTLTIEAGAADGTAQTKTKRIHRVDVRFADTLGLLYGPNADTLDEETFTYGTEVSAVPELFTDDLKITWNGGYDKKGQIYLKGEGPYPAQIQAIVPRVHTQDV